MPDIHTRNPALVRDLLDEAGFTCGVPPRVLEGRDPAWTCIVDGVRLSGDLYVHPAADAAHVGGLPATAWVVIAAALGLVALVEAVLIARLRRAATPGDAD